MKKELLLLLIILINISCNRDKNCIDKFVISGYHVGFECNVCEIRIDKNILSPYEMHIFATFQNNTQDTLFFGAFNYRYSPELRKYGFFQLVYDDIDTIDLYSHYDILDVLPERDLDVKISCYDERFLDRLTSVDSNYESLEITSILNKCKLIYRPILKDYEDIKFNNPFLEEEYNVYFNNYWVGYTSQGKEFISFNIKDNDLINN